MNKTLCLLAFVVLAGAGCTTVPKEDPVIIPDTSLNKITPVIPTSDSTFVSLADFTQPPTSFPGVLSVSERQDRFVVISTSEGDVTVKLYGEESPKAVSNFLVLANTGYYNDVKFHRVISGFMIQTGDPKTKDDTLINAWGTGGPGYQFADELGGEHTEYLRGTLAMAHAGPGTNGSQFFIMHQDYPLPNNYTIFGEVVEGMDVIDKIAASRTTGSPSDRPLEPVFIKSMELQP